MGGRRIIIGIWVRCVHDENGSTSKDFLLKAKRKVGRGGFVIEDSFAKIVNNRFVNRTNFILHASKLPALRGLFYILNFKIIIAKFLMMQISLVVYIMYNYLILIRLFAKKIILYLKIMFYKK